MTNKPDFIKQWRVTGTLLSPLHIGTGEPLDPFTCVLEGRRLHQFDLAAAATEADYGTKESLLHRLENQIDTVESAEEVRKLLTQLPWRNHIINSYDLSDGASERLGRTGTWGTWEIMPFIHNPINGKRYIPGSSLKGALRTGVVSGRGDSLEPQFPPPGLDARAKDRWLEGRARQIEEKTLGGAFANDPFSEWFVADAWFTDAVKSVLMAVEMVNVKPGQGGDSTRPQRPVGFPHLVEAIVPEGTEPHFQFSLTLRKKPLEARLKSPIDLDELHQSSFEHTGSSFDFAFKEPSDSKAVIGGLPKKTRDELARMDQVMDDIYDDECILALGRFTGFLSKTVEKHRVLKEHGIGKVRRREKTGDDAIPNSRMLTDDGRPFGFVKLIFEEV